jgi:hypothetical protein
MNKKLSTFVPFDCWRLKDKTAEQRDRKHTMHVQLKKATRQIRNQIDINHFKDDGEWIEADVPVLSPWN